MKVSTFEVRLTEPDDFIAELRQDMAMGLVDPPLVRLAVTEAPATEGLCGNANPISSDRLMPYDLARAIYIEASYLTTANWMAKLSKCVGFKWGPAALTESRSRNITAEKVADCERHNLEVGMNLSRRLRQLDVDLQTIEGITLRRGVLALQESSWTAFNDETIAAPPELRCRHCDEPIYHSNEAWRHKATGRAEAQREVPCEDCMGSGQRRGAMCRFCFGKATRAVTDHLAEVAEAVPA